MVLTKDALLQRRYRGPDDAARRPRGEHGTRV